MPHLEGREVGGCKLIRKIGAGGMGEVYLGEQIRVGNRSVAVKVVSPDDMTYHPEQANDIARRFEREAAILGNLSHPNILPVHDSGVQDGMLYLVMEYAPDGSLADALRGSGKHHLTLPLSLPFAVDLVSQVAAALQYTHDHGVVHRDVKPGNVLLRVEPNGHWHVLLADFGVARTAEVDSQRTQVSGTFIYMAPEQFSAKFSPASDQYALAIMTYQLLAGHPPFDGDLATLTRAHMYEMPPSLHAANPAVPVAVDAVITRALAKDPAQRYPSVADFATALRAAAGMEDETTEPGTRRTAPATVPVAAGAGIAAGAADVPAQWPAETPTSIARAKRRSSPWRLLAVALAAVLLLALLIGGTQYLQRNQANVSATQTAQAQVTQTAQPTVTATAGATATATATGAPNPLAVPTCTSPLTISSDANCMPPSPVQGTQILNDASPGCVSSGVNWTIYANTEKTCSQINGTVLTDTASQSLACLEAQSVTAANGYASVFVTKGSGDPVLVFRQGETPGGGTVANSTGYFFKVAPGSEQFVFYRIDSSGSTILQSGTIPGALAQHFVPGVAYTGTTFTLYINGVQVGSTVTDSHSPAISSGWYGLCVDHNGGSASYRSAQETSSGS